MQKNTWTSKENAVLIKHYKLNLSDEQISRHLPGRTANAVRIQRSALGFVSYTKKKGYKRKQKAPFVRGAAKLPEGSQPTLFDVSRKFTNKALPGKSTEITSEKLYDKIMVKQFSDTVSTPANTDFNIYGSISISINPSEILINGLGLEKNDVARIFGLIISKIL